MLSSQLILITLITVIAFDVGLGGGLYLANRSSLIVQKFALFTVSLAFWTLTIIGYYSASANATALVWMRLAYVGGLSVAVTFFYFAIRFPRQLVVNRWLNYANIVTIGAFFWSITSTPLIVRSVSGSPWDRVVTLNVFGWYAFTAYFLFTFLAAHAILLRSYLQSSGIARIQLKYIVTSVFVGGEIFGTYFNLILPSPLFLNWDYIWIGPLAAAGIIVPAIAFAVVKYQLLNLKIVATEILVSVATILAYIDVLLYRSIDELILRSVIALGITVFGIMLVKSVHSEVRRREELQQVSAKLADANVHLKAMDEIKSDFVSIASHQLRTPVSVLKGYLSLLMEGAYGKVSKDALDKMSRMYSMNERLIQLINNLLEVSRIEKNKIEFTIVPVDLAAIIGQAIDEMRLRAADKKIELAGKFPGGTKFLVLADEEKLKEVMSNLIDNAIKYSTGGSITIEVESPAPSARSVKILVSDQGYGMTKEQAKRLFEKYYRVNAPETTHQSGTGLGLYICQTFISGMGGKIWVEATRPGKGTTFALTLPLQKIAPARKRTASARRRRDIV